MRRGGSGEREPLERFCRRVGFAPEGTLQRRRVFEKARDVLALVTAERFALRSLAGRRGYEVIGLRGVEEPSSRTSQGAKPLAASSG